MDLPKQEEEILEFWKKIKAFEKSISRRSKNRQFVFYEGPPTANGKPGIHHVLSRAYKDVVCRYKTMRGYRVERKAGWDTHGLPVEIEVEKELGLKNKKDIEAYGIGAFNEKCRASVWKYKEDWDKVTERIGFWIDLDHPYITYDPMYMETLWRIIKQAHEKGLLYEGHKVVPYCARCGTSLSSHEVALGYADVTEDSVFVKFLATPPFPPLLRGGVKGGESRVYLLAWTTTPWTLPGNVALAVGEKTGYVAARQGDEVYILAKERLSILSGEYQIIKELKGKELEGIEYEPLYDSLKDEKEKKYYVALADFVTTEEGTGIVHTAVMYGEDDYNLGEKLGLPKVHTVDESGKFNNLVPKWQGKFVKDAEPEIIADLFARNLLYKSEPHTHSYPFCWRCKRPLLYYARPSWFIGMASLREKLLKNNSTINWIPEHIKEGRFGEWLKEVKDWNFSRSRYWGTPLPIWKCEKCGYVRVVGSIEELGTQAPRNERGEIDLHRPYVDEVFFQCPSCKDASSDAMKRVPELADVWFDSGAMPFASGAAGYPADYISEAIDQTRGWFYTLLAVAAVLGKRAPYKNVISLGHVLDKHGKKMSKSVGNTVDPWIIIQKYGSDALRWYFYTLNQPGDYKKFDENDVRKTYGKFISTLLNTVLFYKTYSQEKSGKFYNPKHVLDKWVISRLNGLILDVGKKLDLYDITGAARDVENFTINDLSNWYIRRSRKRFQTPRTKGEKKEAEQVLGFVLLEVSKLCAPFIPFLSEHMHQELQYTIYNIRYTRSVHWENFPKADTKHIKKKIEGEMAKARKVVEMGHELRARAGIKVRQPLSQLTASVKFSKEMSAIMADELNLKVVEYKMKDGFQVENEFWKVNTEGDILVALNTEMTKELREEGFVKELMRHVQESRKAAGLRPKDRIEIYYSTSKELGEIIQRWAIPLKRQNNANVIQEVEGRREDGEGWGEFAWEGNKVWVGIKK